MPGAERAPAQHPPTAPLHGAEIESAPQPSQDLSTPPSRSVSASTRVAGSSSPWSCKASTSIARFIPGRWRKEIPGGKFLPNLLNPPPNPGFFRALSLIKASLGRGELGEGETRSGWESRSREQVGEQGGQCRGQRGTLDRAGRHSPSSLASHGLCPQELWSGLCCSIPSLPWQHSLLLPPGHRLPSSPRF